MNVQESTSFKVDEPKFYEEDVRLKHQMSYTDGHHPPGKAYAATGLSKERERLLAEERLFKEEGFGKAMLNIVLPVVMEHVKKHLFDYKRELWVDVRKEVRLLSTHDVNECLAELRNAQVIMEQHKEQLSRYIETTLRDITSIVKGSISPSLTKPRDQYKSFDRIRRGEDPIFYSTAAHNSHISQDANLNTAYQQPAKDLREMINNLRIQSFQPAEPQVERVEQPSIVQRLKPSLKNPMNSSFVLAKKLKPRKLDEKSRGSSLDEKDVSRSNKINLTTSTAGKSVTKGKSKKQKK